MVNQNKQKFTVGYVTQCLIKAAEFKLKASEKYQSQNLFDILIQEMQN
jgi:hypothetical protein